MANLGPGIGLLVVGLLMTIFGAAVYSTCTSAPAVNGVAPDCGGFGWLIGLGVILLLVGAILIAVAQFGRRTPMVQQVSDPSVPPPIIRPVVVQQTVEKDVVKVRCTFCGNLCDETAKACPSCGAPIG
jgi:hypothetical protein